jgi:hypothetical protein
MISTLLRQLAMLLATKIFVSDDVRCRCDGVTMLKATSQIRRIAVVPTLMASVFAAGGVDRGFESMSTRTKHYSIGISVLLLR